MPLKKLDQLIATIMNLFVSGVDRNHSLEDILGLLKEMEYGDLLNVLTNDAKSVYGCLIEGDASYRANQLVEQRGVRIYQEDLPMWYMKIDDRQIFSHTLELWLLSDMSFLVTSCFQTVIPDQYLSEYRTIKGTCWKDTDLHIDFAKLAKNLEDIAAIFVYECVPVYEM